MASKKQIVILGAGISGLSLGWYLKQKYGSQLRLTICESSPRAGGWIQTVCVGKFLFEQGARGFRPKGRGRTTLELIEALGLTSSLIQADRNAATRYLLEKNTLVPVSLSFLLRAGLIRACVHEWRTPSTSSEDESIFDFFARRFNIEFAQCLADPLVKGIFGGDAATLSIKSCFPSLWELEQQTGSLLRGWFCQKFRKTVGLSSTAKSSNSHLSKTPLLSFKYGMETLTHTLSECLQEHLSLSTRVEKISCRKDKVSLILSNGILEADFVISTLPLHVLSEICEEISDYARDIFYQTLSTINLGWEGSHLPQKGFGFLVPSREQEAFLGMTWDSSIFPQHNVGEMTRACIMMNGTDTPEALSACAQEVCARVLGISQKPSALHINTAHRAIPQYTLGYARRFHALSTALPERLRLLGTLLGGVGINDCITHAKTLATSF